MSDYNVFAQYADLADERNNRLKGKSLWTRFVGMLNNWFNVEHDWMDYSSRPDSLTNTVGSYVEPLLNKVTGAGLTGSEREANAFNAAEAEKQRAWEEQMSSTAYQRQVVDMRAAGINPAIAMTNGAGGASTPSGSVGASVSPSSGMSFSDLMQLLMLPLQKKLLNSQAQLAMDQGKAALMTAGANVRNAGTNERNADTQSRSVDVQSRAVDVQQIRADIENRVADSNIRVNEQTIAKMAADIAYVNESAAYISKNYDVAVKNADAHVKQALASMKSAEAAFQNALTNEYLSNYQTDVMFSTAFLNDLLAQEKRVDISYLPEKYQAQIGELRSRGYLFDQQGRLVDKQGKLVDAQTAETYTRMAVEITHAACEVVNTAVGVIPGKSPAPIGFPK